MAVGEMKLELQLFGPFAVVYDDQPLDTFRSNKTRALLAYLVTEDAFAEKGRPAAHQRERLMALLWPRTPQQSAQVNLRQTLYQLRQAIPEVAGPDGGREPFLLSDRQTVQVNRGARYHLDVARFLRLQAKDPSPDELAEAVSLYRGPFLSDFHLPDSETFEEWAAGRRATLQRMALEALETLTEHHLQRAQPVEAERYARRQLEIDELWESGHRQLMRALAQQGRRNTALAHYEEYRALLADELTVEPSVESEALYASLRAGEVGAALAPLARAEPDAREKRRLPSPVTPFVGRQREMAQVNGMLENGCRLLTLLGPGGSGKTRLAIEVARRRAGEYTHGAVFVELAPLSDPANIPTAIAAALDFHFTSAGTPRDQILNYLANKDLLLVLDNVEHLLGGADLVADLLHTAPGVSVMATSRARLNIGSECLFEVRGLAHLEDGAEAVEMFMEYVRRVRPGFDGDGEEKPVVIQICRLVEGMPLAIELAASWVRYLSPADIARELAEDVDFLESTRADLPERQRSMRAAFDHSWNLLDEDGPEALMKLSAFRGGASRRAAKAVTGASLQALAALADHALLTLDPDSGRFAVHELIRQFALERLEEAGEADAVRDAHSDYYLQALAGRLPDLKGRDQLGALDAIERDFENVRAAWRWAVRQRRWQHLSQASQTLYLFAL
ncbi:MAG: BTAD domain-containing putative transcriptional regulator, partial [Candidatus Promineifilaceae bacterium]|nr:BTAD domain-containing putative transcriptional regulator [Candidatus Promineifilaceae bacterium]